MLTRFVLLLIVASVACKRESEPTIEPPSEPPFEEPESTDEDETASANAEFVAVLTCGLVEDPTACTSDDECRLSNLTATSSCCSCAPTYAISQHGMEDWVLAEEQRACAEPPGIALVDGRWTRVACHEVDCSACAGAKAYAEPGGVCRAGHCAPD